MNNLKIKNYPEGKYTPHIFLQNPEHQCKTKYFDVEDGVIKTDSDYAGLGFYFPWADRVYGKNPDKRFIVTMGFVVSVNNKFYMSKNDIKELALFSKYHTTNLFSYNLDFNNITLQQLFWRDKTVNGIFSKLDFVKSKNSKIYTIIYAEKVDGIVKTILNKNSGFIFKTDSVNSFKFSDIYFNTDKNSINLYIGDSLEELQKNILQKRVSSSNVLQKEKIYLAFETDTDSSFYLGKKNFNLKETPSQKAVDDSLRNAVAIENEFYKDFPVLNGDWPEVLKHGWLYDFETTRLCTLPPKGIFKDWWPTWMTQWPRVVLAEGTMDMNRLGYANIDIAKRAVLSVFRDTKNSSANDNAPCLFASGYPNMVAKDGEICGTSIAWVLPYYNIYDLYLRCLDKGWIKKLYPYMKKLLGWWLEYRTDVDGWMIYKCTWEAGEDNNPRIDPEETGSSVISENIRPVELQACMAHSAEIMIRFCRELSIDKDISLWEKIKKNYAEKLQLLWDPEKVRFRDWNKKTGSFIKETGIKNYWDEDFTRFSPLSLSAVQFDLMTAEQTEAMKQEILLYDRVPFNVWPSWNFVTMEAASKLNLNQFASEFAYKIIDRVYHENDRYDLNISCPLPGHAREYWPVDLKDYEGNHAYAWGAQTASMLIRQIIGIKASDNTMELEFILTPSIPKELMIHGKCYSINNFKYRNIKLDINYKILSSNTLELEIKVLGEDYNSIYINDKLLDDSFKIDILNFEKYKVIIHND
jgi:hypothetical protein